MLRKGDRVKFMRVPPAETFLIQSVLGDDMVFMRSTKNPKIIAICHPSAIYSVESEEDKHEQYSDDI